MNNQSDRPEAARQNRGIFEDPAIQQAAENDAFARFVVRHWRTLLLTLVAVGAAIFGVNVFRTTALQKRAHATQLLTQIQENFHSLVRKQDEVDDLQQKAAKASSETEKGEIDGKVKAANVEIGALKEKITLMTASLDSPKPFDSLASLYRGLLAGRLHEYDTVNTILSEVAWEQLGKQGSSERFIGEVATLGLARYLCESDKYMLRGKESLQGLAERWEFVAVEAASALALVASTPEEKAKVVSLIADLQLRFPAQQKYLTEVAEHL